MDIASRLDASCVGQCLVPDAMFLRLLTVTRVVFWRTRFGFEFFPRGAAHSNDDIHFIMRHVHCRMPNREEKFDNGALLAGACETGVSLSR